MHRISLTESAYNRLRNDILNCRLRPGDRLNINELCAAMTLNLSAVREALARLSAEGLVVSMPRKGFKVAPMSAADLSDLTRTRIEIESLCLRRSIALGGVPWECDVISTYHAMTRMDRYIDNDEFRPNPDWWPPHALYHRALCNGCDSPWLMRLRDLLFVQSERYRMSSAPLARVNRDVDAEHRDLTDAVLARDIECAVKLLAAHLEKTSSLLAATKLLH